MTDPYNPTINEWDGSLQDLLRPPAWHSQARCKGKTTMFFPPFDSQEGRAKSICSTCPVRQECLNAGRREGFGIWGGTSARQRKKMRREGL